MCGTCEFGVFAELEVEWGKCSYPSPVIYPIPLSRIVRVDSCPVNFAWSDWNRRGN